MRLEEKMERVSEAAAEKLPADALEVMQEHTRELKASGQAEAAVGVGERAPDFTLSSAAGDTVRLADELTGGPVILSFYRGRW